jgi:hypothetical protein
VLLVIVRSLGLALGEVDELQTRHGVKGDEAPQALAVGVKKE